MSSYFYSRLDRQGQAAYKRTVDAISSRKAAVEVGRMGAQEFQEIIKRVSFDRPEYFFVNFQELRMYSVPGLGMVWQVYYWYRGPALEQAVQNMEGEIQRVVRGATSVRQDSVLDTCRWIHNYLVRNVRYNDAALKNSAQYPEAYTIEGVFKQGTAVCEGIAKAVTLLGDRLGVELPAVYGMGLSDQAGLDGPHAWNLFCLDGVYAHLDVTWNICLSRPLRYTRYDYFGLSDRDISADHAFEREIVAECAENSRLSYFEWTGTLLANRRQCEQYVEGRFRQKKTVVYFKYQPAKRLPAGIGKKMDALVVGKAEECFQTGFTVHMAPNLPQGVFFY